MSNILNLQLPWAIRKEAFIQLNKIKAELSSKTEINAETSTEAMQTLSKSGAVAVIRIEGIITRYGYWWSNDTNVESLKYQINEAVNDDSISSILLDVNSPGGQVDGIAELAEQIYNARSKKNIVAYISNDGCSAAYWLASAANQIVINKIGVAGSIGVIANFGFYTDENYEEINIVSGVSPKKIIDLKTEEGKTQIQKQVDDIALHFVNDVALYRDVERERVLEDFGQGDIIMGAEAVASGLVDSVGNFNSALSLAASLSVEDSKTNNKNQGEDLTMSKKIKFQASGNSAKLVIVDDEKVDVSDAETVETIDKAWIEKNLPDVAKEFEDSGADDEQVRQSEITEAEETAGDKEAVRTVIANARKDRAVPSANVYKDIMKAEQSLREKMAGDRRADASNIQTGQQPDNGNNEVDKAEFEALQKATASGMGM